mmetsp:Transcript_118793/g.341020  ORF Transcript_118793/g.341020 Transcript_118793/m.341020 type:complete len:237 (-) Transcript_118793:1702-2412(-)
MGQRKGRAPRPLAAAAAGGGTTWTMNPFDATSPGTASTEASAPGRHNALSGLKNWSGQRIAVGPPPRPAPRREPRPTASNSTSRRPEPADPSSRTRSMKKRMVWTRAPRLQMPMMKRERTRNATTGWCPRRRRLFRASGPASVGSLASMSSSSMRKALATVSVRFSPGCGAPPPSSPLASRPPPARRRCTRARPFSARSSSSAPRDINSSNSIAVASGGAWSPKPQRPSRVAVPTQ